LRPWPHADHGVNYREGRASLKEGVWVQDIAANRAVAGVYLAKEKKLLKGKTGKPYVLLRIMDRTGEVEARIWDRVQELGSRFQAGDLIRVSGEAISYQGVLQIKIKELNNASNMRDEHHADFVPGYFEARERSRERFEQLREVAGRIKSAWLRTLVESFLGDDTLEQGWLTAPAARGCIMRGSGGSWSTSFRSAASSRKPVSITQPWRETFSWLGPFCTMWGRSESSVPRGLRITPRKGDS
jgi:hypothetical protein